MKNSHVIDFLISLRKNLKFTIICSIIGLISGIIYTSLFYQPIYRSTAKLLVKNTNPAYANYNPNDPKLPDTSIQNSDITDQMNLFKSDKLSQKVWEKIGLKDKLHKKTQAGKLLINKAIIVRNPKNTGIIELTASWNNPQTAKDIATEYIAAYSSANVKNAANGINQDQNSMRQKLSIANSNLAHSSQKISLLRQEGKLTELNTEITRQNNWSNIIKKLQQEESQQFIQELDTIGNVKVIDLPRENTTPIFPNNYNIIEMFIFAGILIGIIAASLDSKHKFADISEIERKLDSPILGVIPWLDESTYNDPNAIIANEDVTSFYSLAYQKIISNIKIRGYKLGAKSFVFSSSEFTKNRSALLMNIAYGLSRAGQTVILVDADFRTPSIHKEFGITPNKQYNLAGLLSGITTEIKDYGEFNWKFLPYFIQTLPEEENLHMLINNGNISEPHEFLHSKAFNILIQKLKEQYDWVLIDTPPLIAVPDATAAALFADAMILITGINVDKLHMSKVKNILDTCKMKLFGIIAREYQDSEAVVKNKYIKQIITEMSNDKSEDDKIISC